MRATHPRRPFAALALLPLLLLLGLLATGCGSDDEGGDANESTSEDASESAASDDASEDEASEDEASEGSEDEGSGDESDEGTEESEGGGGDVSSEDAALCDPYLGMVEELGGLDYTAKPDAVAAKMGPIMKEWATGLADAEQPTSMDDAAWNGLQTLAARVSDLPDKPTNADITAVEEGLTAQEQAEVDAAGKWFESTCAPA